MKNKKTLLSIITPTLNNQKDIKHYLDSVRRQNKKNFKVEVLILDGGSVDKTKQIARKYGTRVIDNPYVLADPGVNLGIKKANGDILMILAADNIFEDKNSLEKIVKVFENKNITAAFPVHSSSKSDSIFTKYINNFTDPFNHFVYGYGANGRTFKKIYKTIESNAIYDVYDYSSNPNRPLIAVAQGFTVRKGFTRNRNSSFDDVLPVIELINRDKKVAFVHSVKLYHHTIRDLKHFVRKQAWATVNALQGKKYGIAHRREYLSENQRLRIKLWPFYSLLIIPVFLRGIYMLIITRDKLWIYHPFLSIISAYTSLVFGAVFLLNRNIKFVRDK